ncbi:carboxypeptidase M32 [Brevibacillus laterosporus]|uniref:carboxypeptidase M32 n=1 Tax=Brevibacillus laterosporus TaxID=1465 RepID=UPI003D2355AD
MSKINQLATDFTTFSKKIQAYNNATAVLYWDLRTKAPKKGMDARSEVISTLSTEAFKLSTSEQMEDYLQRLTEEQTYKQLDAVTQKLVEESKKEFDLNKKIPTDRYQEYVLVTNQAENLWEEAREKNDFSLFRPYLEKIVKMKLEFINYWGPKPDKYDTLLDQYEPGMTVKQLDQIFTLLRDKTVPLVHAINESNRRPNISFMEKHFAKADQAAFNQLVLKKIGFDFQAGRLDTSTHPFCIHFGSSDVRLTTRYDEQDFRYALWSSIHEAGHGMYEQNVNTAYNGLLLSNGTSMGVHESQSRFWENMVGRSLPFWEHFYPAAQQAFPEQFAGVALEDFYRAANLVEPSFIRTESDELTYNLHIMVRYEIEKGLINETIEVGELPQIWNKKMKEYLGVDVPSDDLGVLQDVHWSSGLMGYFPTYSLGNVYAAQFTHAMKKQLPSFDDLLRAGDFTPLNQWLRENIHQFGKMKSPQELLQHVTGEQVNASYLVDYLETKYKDLYQL